MKRPTRQQREQTLADARASKDTRAIIDALLGLIEDAPIMSRIWEMLTGWIQELRQLGEDELAPLTECRVAIRAGLLALNKKQLRQAEEEGRIAYSVLAKADVQLAIQACAVLALALIRQKQIDKAQELFLEHEPLLADLDATAEPALYARGLWHLAQAELMVQRFNFNATREQLGQAVTYLEAVGFPADGETYQCKLALGFVSQGQSADALVVEHLKGALDIARRYHSITEELAAITLLAPSLVTRQAADEGIALLIQGVGVAHHHGVPQTEGTLLELLISALRAQQRHQEGLAYALQLMKTQADRGNVSGYVQAVFHIADIYVTLTQYIEAYRSLKAAYLALMKGGQEIFAKQITLKIEMLRKTMGEEAYDQMIADINEAEFARQLLFGRN